MSKKKVKVIECYACGKSDIPLINFGKNSLCQPCISLDSDGYENVEIDLDDRTLLVAARTAMEENVTINAVLSHILLQYARNKVELKNNKKSCKCSKNGCGKKCK